MGNKNKERAILKANDILSDRERVLVHPTGGMEKPKNTKGTSGQITKNFNELVAI